VNEKWREILGSSMEIRGRYKEIHGYKERKVTPQRSFVSNQSVVSKLNKIYYFVEKKKLTNTFFSTPVV
jgi:hypothetical protein